MRILDTFGMKYDERLSNAVDTLHYAFQPIVNIHSGEAIGFEALLRGHEKVGYDSIQDFFDTAYSQLSLYSLDLKLRDKAFKAFSQIISRHGQRLFYNIDNRLLHMPDYAPGNTDTILTRYNLSTANLCFEISERHDFGCVDTADSILKYYKENGYCIALDDYGSGFAGLQMLYHAEPNHIKIDRFFIHEIDKDPKKRFFVSNIVSMAHVLGARVIAEGIETPGEMLACRDIGCDYGQGFYIQKPQTDYSKLKDIYPQVQSLIRRDRRERNKGSNLNKFMKVIDEIPAVTIGTSMSHILECFKADASLEYLPVVNSRNEPLGIIGAKQLRSYVYSPYGIALIQNQEKKNDLKFFMNHAPVIELGSSLEKILQIHSLNVNDGILIFTRNGKYAGLLNAPGLLKLITDKKLDEALNSNPLTRLPGNKRINEWLVETVASTKEFRGIAYLDFDNFKPFNDTYGFRIGDRAIMLFAEILKKKAQKHGCFAGHIGGDDFFVGSTGNPHFPEIVTAIQERFKNDIQSIYKEEDRKQGFIIAKSRGDGPIKQYPLMTVSAAIINIPAGVYVSSVDYSSCALAELKSKAKIAQNKQAALMWTDDLKVNVDFSS